MMTTECYMPVYGIYGLSNSGKTTLLCSLVEWFTQKGLRVATVKKTDKAIYIDTVGKDTWKHRESGADLAVFSSVVETCFIVPHQLDEEQIVGMIAQLGCFDMVFIEGAVSAGIPKIRCGSAKKRVNTIVDYTDTIKEVIEVISRHMVANTDSGGIQLKVNGKNIPLTEFPSGFIKSTIKGMVSSLKGVDTVNQVELTIQYP